MATETYQELYDTAGDYTYTNTEIEVFNSYARLLGHQDASATPGIVTNNGADDEASGEFGPALKIVKANTDYVANPDSAKLSVTGNLTLECWVKFNTHPIPNAALIDKYVSGGNQRCYMLYIASGKLYLTVSSNGASTATVVEASATLLGSTWYHLAGVYDGSELRIYIDGTSAATPTAYSSGIFDGTPAVNLGGIYAGWYADIDMDEVRISDSVRYTTNFTPSTSEFVADANTMYLNHMSDSVAHVTTDPAINRTANTSLDVDAWNSFTETATKYGADAEIKYQLYNGSNYQYWNGGAWANSDGTYAQSNTAATINTNIATFTTGTFDFNVKALLHADTADTPILDQLDIVYDEVVAGGAAMTTGTKLW